MTLHKHSLRHSPSGHSVMARACTCSEVCYKRGNSSNSGASNLRLRGKKSTCKAVEVSSVPGSERSPAGGHGNPLEYSCLQNPVYRGVWQATVHQVSKSRTQLSDWAYTHMQFYVRIPCKSAHFLSKQRYHFYYHGMWISSRRDILCL